MDAPAPAPAPTPARAELPRPARLWLAVLGSPIAWATDLTLRYGLIRTVSATSRTYLLVVVSAVTLAAVITCAVICHGERRRARADGGDGDDGEPARSRRTLATWGLALAAFSGLLILAQAFPDLMLGPRDLT
jgi:hypothetical protein